MAQLQNQASHAIIWITYVVLLVSSCFIAWKKQDKNAFLSENGTQKGVPLALNFVASGLGVGIFTAFPQIANVSGLQGLLIYSLCGALPMLIFAALGPIIRKKTPDGFVLTEWVFERYGRVTGLYFSLCTILTLFLFLVSDLASLKYALKELTKINPLSVIIVECIVTTIYTSVGGFKISFITDMLQVGAVFLLLFIMSCAVGAQIEIDTSQIAKSGLLKQNKLGWQLIYILSIAIVTNDFFMAGFWLRTFASKTNKDLWIGCSLAALIQAVFVVIIGVTGLIVVWAGFLTPDSKSSTRSFFLIMEQMPRWVVGFAIIFTCCLSTCTVDSLQSALVSTISNDILRNKVKLIWVRCLVGAIMVPVIVVSLIAEDILQIWLIVDLLACTLVPVMMLGLSSHFDFLTAWEVVGGSFGGILLVFIFGTIYYHSPLEGGRLLIIYNGLYYKDWGAFGAFVAAPFGSILFAFVILAFRSGIIGLYSYYNNSPFEVFNNKDFYKKKDAPEVNASANESTKEH